MYGRNNIFTRSSNNNNNTTYSNNNSYNNTPSNSFANNSYDIKIGSYRLDYKYEEPPSYITSLVSIWKEIPPSTIVSKEETLHMGITELRIEDYYLIRNKKLRSSHQQKLQDAIRRECFNEQLLRCDSHKLPPISQQKGYDIDALRSGRYGSASNQNIYGNNTNTGYSNSYNNGYNNNNNNSNNIFTRGSNSSTNIFMNNSNANNQSTNNLFSNNSQTNNPNKNIFSNNNSSNNSGSVNIFAGNNNSSGNNIFNNNSNSSGNNIFNSSSGNNRNIFNGANNNTSNNIFNSSNNNNASNNIFNSNNNNNRNNIFNNNNTNNLFNRNNNNNNNNIFANRQNDSIFNNQNNNLFNNNNNPNTLFPNNNLFDTLQTYLFQNRLFLQQISNRLTNNNPIAQKPLSPAPSNIFQNKLEQNNDLFEIDSWVQPKSAQPTIVVVRDPQISNNQILRSSNIRSQMTKSNLTDKSILHSQNSRIFAKNNSHLSRQYPNETKFQTKKPIFNTTSSQLYTNHNNIQDSDLRSVNKSKSANLSNQQHDKSHNNKNIFRNYEPIYHKPCQCRVKLQIVWTDDNNNQMTKSIIQDTVELSRLQFSDKAVRAQLIYNLKNKYPFVRTDSQLRIIDCTRIDQFPALFSLEGYLQQKIFNIDPSYKLYHTQIKDNHAYTLTISNEHATVIWQRPVPLLELDFHTDEFTLANNTIVCDVNALSGRCRVTFNNLPDKIKQIIHIDLQKAKSKFQEHVLRLSEGKFHLTDIWCQNGNYGWSINIDHF